MVMKMYPKTEKEKQGCLQEIDRMTALRDLYKKRLEQERNNKREGTA